MAQNVKIDGIDYNIDNDDKESIRLVDLLMHGQNTESDIQEQIAMLMSDLAIVQHGLVGIQAQLVMRLKGTPNEHNE